MAIEKAKKMRISRDHNGSLLLHCGECDSAWHFAIYRANKKNFVWGERSPSTMH